MFPLSLCRVCLTQNTRMLHINNSKLVEIYEKLSSSSFNKGDGKPQTICYICYSQLVKSCRFSDMAHKSQIILQDLVDKGTEVKHETINSQNLSLTHNLSVTPVLCMTINDTTHEFSWVKTKQDVTEGIYPKNDDNIKVKESTFEEEINISLLSSNQLDSLIKAAIKGRDEFSDNVKVVEETIKNEDFIEIEESTLENDIGIGNKTNNEDKERDMMNECSLVSVEQDVKEDISGKVEEVIEIEEVTFKNDIGTGHATKKIENPLLKERLMNDYERESYFYCDVCNNKFASKYLLVAHLKIHSGEKTFQSHWQPRIYVCEGCDRAFEHKSNLRKHMRIHTGEKPYACQICKKSFAQNYDLTIHTRFHTGEKPFMCNKCDRAFAIKTHLTKHMLIHTRELPYCQKCDKTFTRKYDLTIHMRIHTNEKPYACKKCCKAFPLQNSLDTHMRNHTDEKLYACKVCDMKFSLKNNLGSHMRIHRGKTLHACQTCNKTFSQKNGLTSHLETHTYACSKCDIKFARKRSLTTHMRIHTEGKSKEGREGVI